MSFSTTDTKTLVQFPENDVVSVEFYMMGTDDHKINSTCTITSKDLFSNDRPIDNGIYSLNMGTTSYSFRCKTCLNTRQKIRGIVFISP